MWLSVLLDVPFPQSGNIKNKEVKFSAHLFPMEDNGFSLIYSKVYTIVLSLEPEERKQTGQPLTPLSTRVFLPNLENFVN